MSERYTVVDVTEDGLTTYKCRECGQLIEVEDGDEIEHFCESYEP